ncbi:MAG: permease-like cell division protein FtsX [Bacteroidales bacterium]|nr:permease-like cell division protein FtsX [Candidatus Cacconaster equi]
MKSNSKIIVRRRLIRSYVTSVISIALVLLLVASAVIFVANARNISRYFKENMAVSVILKQSTLEKEARALASDLAKKDYVKESRFISKEEGAKEMETLLGEDFLDVFESSPIPMSVDLHLNGDAITTDSLNVIKKNLLENPIVEDIVYQENLIEALNANLQRISLVLAIIIVLLMIISFALISNTVRLNIYARRFTIHTMSLVGAKRSFIARPFVIQAVIEGAVAGGLACGVIAAAMYWLSRDSEVLNAILDKQIVALSLVGTVILGIAICVLSTLFVVNKVAYISKDDLYY